jgi:hypothetical protein
MRTKTLLLTAALGAAGIATSMAQVYSQNAVGYINVTVGPGFTMIANQLIPASTLLSALIPAPPLGTSIYKFDNGNFKISTFDEFESIWTPLGPGGTPNTDTIDFGSGVFIRNPQSTPFTITFVGEVAQGTPVSNPIPVGFSIRSSKIPQAGKIQTDLGFPPLPGDSIYRFNTASQSFFISTYDEFELVWTPKVNDLPVEPTIEIGESFFVLKTAAGSWDRNFTVN